jgi:hypothetical protein
MLSAASALAGCPNENDVFQGGECNTEGGPEIDGDWSEEVEDWSDPGAAGNDTIANPCGFAGSITAHHCYTTAVHAIHMHTGELLLFHGERDQRVWKIGTDPSEMRWHPLPYGGGSPDLFCSGHVQLADGKVFIAGGNVTGMSQHGGLQGTFLFEPVGAQPAGPTGCPFGWGVDVGSGTYDVSQSPFMEYDRWYPTLTALGDGRVLISGGYSTVQGGGGFGDAERTRVLEVYDPTASPPTMVTLDQAPFPGPADHFPVYPLMFQLPNGDVFYAGSEDADAENEHHGRILVTNQLAADAQTWAWSSHVVNSDIAGGSAVMYEPGRILKTGGRAPNSQDAVDGAEVVWLDDDPPGDYSNAPNEFFTIPGGMIHPRHYHTLTLLPDGRVLATGGNTYFNGRDGENWNNPCEDGGGQFIEDAYFCANGCPSECINYARSVDFAGTQCETPSPDLGCSLLRSIRCTCTLDAPADDDEQECAARPNCAWVDGECEPIMNPDEFCGEAMADAECCDGAGSDAGCGPGAGGRCTRPCDAQNPCDPIFPVNGECLVRSDHDGSRCGVKNNACFAVREAEIWDPTCESFWLPMGEQEHPRMYHSTALLLPDGRVISMGGGHRQGLDEQIETEYFEPQYAEDPDAPKPNYGFGTFGFWVGPPDPGYEPNFLPWDGYLHVTVQTDDPVPVDYATLVRLGSVTHQFDMDQRIIKLDVDGEWPSYTVFGPQSKENAPARNIAPPGYYMLFLISEDGEPSIGRYVRVGDESSASFVCEATSMLEATETSCSAEPDHGECPSGAVVTTAVPIPQALGPTGLVEGFEVYVPPGVVENATAPTAEEIAIVEQLCAAACEEHFTGRPGQTANCDEAGVFETPVFYAAGIEPSLDLLHDDARHGEGIFTGQQLACDLGTSCYAAFNEGIGGAVPRRTTPGESKLDEGEQYRIPLGSSSKVEVITNEGTYASPLTGSVAYSFCSDGNAASPCPFYLGSFYSQATNNLGISMECADQTTAQHYLRDLQVKLAQPAFGIAEQGTTNKGFPAGALILDASFGVGTTRYTLRRPVRQPVTLKATGTSFDAQTLDVTLTVPCNSSYSQVTLRFRIKDKGDGSALGKPPMLSISTPSTVTCGVPTNLTASTYDPDGDFDELRWFVDDVLLARTTTSLTFTAGAELKAVAYDDRGATAMQKKVISCQ